MGANGHYIEALLFLTPGAVQQPDRIDLTMAKKSQTPSCTYELVDQSTVVRYASSGGLGAMQSLRWRSKLVPLCVAIPIAVSLALQILDIRHYQSTGVLRDLTTSNRASVQVVVHILSTLLAVLLVYPICTVISFWTRHALTQRDIRINRLRLWSALVRAKPDWNLPWLYALIAAIFFLSTYFPAAFWAGALTPVLTEKVEHNLPFLIPFIETGNHSFLYPYTNTSTIVFTDCWTKIQSNGTFNNCPLKFNTGNILSSVASATNPKHETRNSTKWDNTNYQYDGRSYGAGGASGLTDGDLISTSSPAQRYVYLEAGLITETTCIYNQSSAWKIDLQQAQQYTMYPDIYLAWGALPNSNWSAMDNTTFKGLDFFAQAGLNGQGEIVATIARPPLDKFDPNGQWMYGIAALSQYKSLDKIQCEIKFRPATFRVSVSVTDRTIVVTPENDVPAQSPDPKMYLRTRTFESINVSLVAISLYSSLVGDAFMTNVRNMQTKNDPNLAKSEIADNATVLAAVADSITAMIEDVMVSLNAAGLTTGDGVQVAHANATIPAVRIGNSGFIKAILAINVMGAIAISCGFLLLWNSDIPLFDFNDLGCVSVGILNGAQCQSINQREFGVLQEWDGSPATADMVHVTARLEVTASGQPAVALR